MYNDHANKEKEIQKLRNINQRNSKSAAITIQCEDDTS